MGNQASKLQCSRGSDPLTPQNLYRNASSTEALLQGGYSVSGCNIRAHVTSTHFGGGGGGGKIYACPLCDYAANRDSSVNAHARKEHGLDAGQGFVAHRLAGSLGFELSSSRQSKHIAVAMSVPGVTSQNDTFITKGRKTRTNATYLYVILVNQAF